MMVTIWPNDPGQVGSELRHRRPRRSHAAITGSSKAQRVLPAGDTASCVATCVTFAMQVASRGRRAWQLTLGQASGQSPAEPKRGDRPPSAALTPGSVWFPWASRASHVHGDPPSSSRARWISAWAYCTASLRSIAAPSRASSSKTAEPSTSRRWSATTGSRETRAIAKAS